MKDYSNLEVDQFFRRGILSQGRHFVNEHEQAYRYEEGPYSPPVFINKGTVRFEGSFEGTLSDAIIENPAISGGTANNLTLGTPIIQGGTVQETLDIVGTVTNGSFENPTIGTPTVEGGTASNLTLDNAITLAGTISGGNINNVTYGDGTVVGSFVFGTHLTIGTAGPGIDYSIVFDGETSDGTATFLEDENEFLFSTRVRVPTIWHVYGGFEDQGEVIACGAGDWNWITNGDPWDLWNFDEADGIVGALDVFTITNGGDYAGNLSMSISGLTGKDFHIRIYNNTQTRVEGRAIGISTTGANNEMNVCVPIYIEATAGDEIQFEIMSTDGSDPTVDDALFYLAYLHD